MPVSSVGSAAPAASAVDQQKSFREADFMKIMLAEITQQDPFKPQEVGKIVEDMRKLQELANAKFEKFRDDIRWAREILGQTVSVQQAQLTEAETAALKEKGVDPGVGYMTVTGTANTYRIVDEVVWVNVDGKDYQLDNVGRVQPQERDGSYLAGLSQGLLGGVVQYPGSDGKTKEGLVSALSLDGEGEVMLSVGNDQVPLTTVTRIRMP